MHYDTIIAGLGTMGAATLWARRTRPILACDRFAPPHDRGEHAGEQRMFRMSYYEHPDYVSWLRKAWDGWHSIPVPSSEPQHFFESGGLYISPVNGGTVVQNSVAAAVQHRLSHTTFESRDIRARFPAFRVPDGMIGMHESQAGFIVPESAVRRFIQQAGDETTGVHIRANEPIEHWTSEPDCVRVRTHSGEYTGRNLVLAAGPWSADLLASIPELQGKLTVTRQVQLWIRPRNPEIFSLGVLPSWAIELPHERGLLYGFPIMAGTDVMKVAVHFPGEPTDPDHVDRSLRASDAALVLESLAAYIPEAVGPVVRSSVCLYTNSPDGHFIVDRHPRHRNVVFACGFSGHGFKFAPAVGQLLSFLLDNPTAQHPAPFISLSRFQQPNQR